ncbi:hypothetical protein M758_12G000900 [Ceratodon purpureus]|uniref:Uncharacterized protein n=1 Tax=Ceratodon purpureus TaxID=3225 RepID=A0A8T0G305_CERPU|nr:hypothetical protein KC19_12G000400 [Ceratodon purpureus]KAG0597515.1 hypothetical protein M758_12G000900 [Ceratodon purpureus]
MKQLTEVEKRSKTLKDPGDGVYSCSTPRLVSPDRTLLQGNVHRGACQSFDWFAGNGSTSRIRSLLPPGEILCFMGGWRIRCP